MIKKLLPVINKIYQSSEDDSETILHYQKLSDQ